MNNKLNYQEIKLSPKTTKMNRIQMHMQSSHIVCLLYCSQVSSATLIPYYNIAR